MRLWLSLTVLALVWAPALATQAPKPAPSLPAETAPALTELEAAKLQAVTLRQQNAYLAAQLQVCQGQLAPQSYKTASEQLQQATVDLVTTFEKAHPGWTIDLGTFKAVKKDQ